MCRALCILLCVIWFGPALAATVSVPTDQPTIQTAIDSAAPGDTILVEPGIYYESLDFGGKSLVISSQFGPDSTALRAPNSNPVSSLVIMSGIPASGAVLSGFVIDSVTHDGGVVRIENSQNCRIEQCRFIANTGVDSVAAVQIVQSTACEIRENEFDNNEGAGGGAVVVRQSSALITGNIFTQNSLTLGNGGAIAAVQPPTTVDLEFNLFLGNTGGELVFVDTDVDATIANNTFVDNVVSTTIHGDKIEITRNIFADSGAFALDSGVTESCNCFHRTIPPAALDSTSFIADPEYCDELNGDYSIAFESPCAPTNNACSTLIGAYDPACNIYTGPVWNVALDGDDSTGIGSTVSPFATIQRGIDAAVNGDTVLVRPGTYTGAGNLDLNTLGKAIVVMSSAGPDSTTINYMYYVGGQFFTRAISILSGEDSSTVIEGFHFTDDGYAPTYGRAIQIIGASPTIRNCVIDGIRGSSAVLCDSAAPIIEQCRFVANWCGCSVCKLPAEAQTYSMRAAAILYANNAGGEVRDCIFELNVADVPSGGGAVSIDRSSPTFRRCTFRANEGWYSCRGGAAVIANGSNVAFDSCLFQENRNSNNTNKTRFGFAVYVGNADASFTDCLFDRNSTDATQNALCASAVFSDVNANISMTGSTIVSHPMPSVNGYSGLYLGSGSTLDVTQSIMAFNQSRPVIGVQDTTVQLSISCTDIFGNAAGNWVGPLAALADTNDNFELNPYFCDTAAADYTLQDISPCSPDNNSCATLIGALDTACINAPPLITSPDSVAVAEHDTLIYVIAFTDPDGPDTSVSVIDYPSWCNLSGDTLTGIPGDGTTDTIFTIIATDGYGADTLIVLIDVIPVNDPPIFTPPPTHTIDEGELLEFVVTVTDEDSDSTRIYVPAPPIGAAFVDSLNGSGLFSWQPDFSQAGDYQVLFVAQDDSLAVDTAIVDITVSQVNLAPSLDSIPEQVVLENAHLEILITAADYDGDSIVLIVDSLPANAAFVDSGDGRGVLTFDPTETQSGDYTLLIIARDTILADSQTVLITVRDINPIIEAIAVDSVTPNLHVIEHNPIISWSYVDPLAARTQSEFRIGIGTDNDSTFHEVWNPAPFQTSDTFIVYNGAPLLDGATYYIFLEVNNGYAFSPPFLDSFRVNSIPTVPDPIAPLDSALTSAAPTLWLGESTDPENDSITFDFEIWLDTTGSPIDTQRVTAVPTTPDSTGWTVPLDLQEDQRYVWRGRAVDGFESSEWSLPFTLYVDAVASAPSTPTTIQPAADSCAVVDSMPTLIWTASIDPDPFDTVRYLVEIGLTAQLEFAEQYDSLTETSFMIPVPLLNGDHYWWRVTAFDLTGDSTVSDIADFYMWVPGDVSNDHVYNIGDITYLVSFLFQGGPSPCPHVGDVDGTCAVNIADLTYLVAFVFTAGPAPMLCEGEVEVGPVVTAAPAKRSGQSR